MNEAVAGTYHIGEVASRVGLSLRTVRHYESLGLVTPTGRSEGGFRLYTEPDVQRLLLVRALKPMELPLEDLHELLALLDRLEGDEGHHGHAAREDRVRLRAILDVARERLARQRERLIAAELALEQLRQAASVDDEAARAGGSDRD